MYSNIKCKQSLIICLLSLELSCMKNNVFSFACPQCFVMDGILIRICLHFKFIVSRLTSFSSLGECGVTLFFVGCWLTMMHTVYSRNSVLSTITTMLKTSSTKLRLKWQKAAPTAPSVCFTHVSCAYWTILWAKSSHAGKPCWEHCKLTNLKCVQLISLETDTTEELLRSELGDKMVAMKHWRQTAHHA